jgi:hypothetical protein
VVDVFISYSRTDLAKVTQLAQAVEAEGYDVWWDADLPPHLSYGDVITAKIGMAKAAIVVWSKDSAASEWVRAEADMARNQKKLVQTALDNIMPPLPFNQIQYAEIGNWHGEPDHPGWRKVKVSLAELCGREPAPRPDRPEAVQHRVAAPVPVAPQGARWPLYTGIAIGAVALLVAGWALWRDAYAEGELAEERRLEAASTAPAQPSAAPSPDGPAEAAAAVPAPVPPPAASEPVAAPAPVVASTDGMVFADSSRRLLRPAEIANLGPATLEIARNEIFARNGRRFARADLRNYFSQFDWYRPVASEVQLNPIEQQNVALLRRAEARFGQ